MNYWTNYFLLAFFMILMRRIIYLFFIICLSLFYDFDEKSYYLFISSDKLLYKMYISVKPNTHVCDCVLVSFYLSTYLSNQQWLRKPEKVSWIRCFPHWHNCLTIIKNNKKFCEFLKEDKLKYVGMFPISWSWNKLQNYEIVLHLNIK